MSGTTWTTARSRCRTIQVRPVMSASTHGERCRGRPPPRAYQIHWTGFGRWTATPMTVGRISWPLPSRCSGCTLPAPFRAGVRQEVPVQISQLLRHKGREVATIDGAESVRTALGVLADKGIGALVVSSDGKRVDGIVSERDVARGLHAHGAGLLTQPVSSLM